VPTVRHRSLALKFSPGTKIFSRSYLILFSPRPGDRRPGGESEWSSLALTADKLCRRGGRAAPRAAKTSTVPYCTVLYCTVQYSTIQYCTGNSTVSYRSIQVKCWWPGCREILVAILSFLVARCPTQPPWVAGLFPSRIYWKYWRKYI